MCWKKFNDFDTIPERDRQTNLQMDGRTDRQTDRTATSISCMRYKYCIHIQFRAYQNPGESLFKLCMLGHRQPRRNCIQLWSPLRLMPWWWISVTHSHYMTYYSQLLLILDKLETSTITTAINNNTAILELQIVTYVCQLTRPTQPFILSGIDKWVAGCK